MTEKVKILTGVCLFILIDNLANMLGELFVIVVDDAFEAFEALIFVDKANGSKSQRGCESV
jgi:hypothetical protein